MRSATRAMAQWRAEHPEEVAQQMAKRRAHLDDPEWHARWLEKHHATHLGRKRSPEARANIAAGKKAAAARKRDAGPAPGQLRLPLYSFSPSEHNTGPLRR